MFKSHLPGDREANRKEQQAGLQSSDAASFNAYNINLEDISFTPPSTNRMAGENQTGPARVSYSFVSDTVFASFSVDYDSRTLQIKFEIGEHVFTNRYDCHGNPIRCQIDPAIEKIARGILTQVRDEYDGRLAKLINWFYGKQSGISFEGPYSPADITALVLDIRVSREQNIDQVYQRIQDLLATHPLHDDRARYLMHCKAAGGEWQSLKYDPARALIGRYNWTAAEMDLVERLPAEDCEPDSAPGSVEARDLYESNSVDNSTAADQHLINERERRAARIRYNNVRKMTPAGWVARKSLNTDFCGDPTRSPDVD